MKTLSDLLPILLTGIFSLFGGGFVWNLIKEKRAAPLNRIAVQRADAELAAQVRSLMNDILADQKRRYEADLADVREDVSKLSQGNTVLRAENDLLIRRVDVLTTALRDAHIEVPEVEVSPE